MHRPWQRVFWLLGLSFLIGVYAVGCFEDIKSSEKLICESDADCWDGLKCGGSSVKICGGTNPEPVKDEPKPEPIKPEPTQPEPTTTEQVQGDGGTNPEPTPPEPKPEPSAPDISCPLASVGGSIELCKNDASCLSLKCQSFAIPGCEKPSKACSCSTQADCRGTEFCCKFGTVGICSPTKCEDLNPNP